MEFNNTKTYQLLQLLDRYGIMTRNQILERFDISEKNLRLAIKELEKQRFVKTYKGQRRYSHYITTKGSEYVGNLSFGYVQGDKEPNLATLRHNLLMNDSIAESIQMFLQDYPESRFQLVTEREILADHYLELKKEYSGRWLRREKAVLRNRIPDYRIETVINGEKIVIAYELELTRKTKANLVKKLHWYKDQIKFCDISSVCYVYDDVGVYEHVAMNAGKMNLHINFYRLGSLGGDQHGKKQ